MLTKFQDLILSRKLPKERIKIYIYIKKSVVVKEILCIRIQLYMMELTASMLALEPSGG